MTTPPPQQGASIAEVLRHLPDAPVATARDRGWTGVTRDLHAFAPRGGIDEQLDIIAA
jgi:hypothetical protein